MLNAVLITFRRGSFTVHGQLSFVNESGTWVYLSDRGEKKAPNGYYDPSDGSIHIDLNAGQSGEGTMLFTVAHELTHFIKDWSSVKYRALADALVKQYQKRGVTVSELVDNQIRKAEQNGREMSRPEAFDEVVADSMESMLSDENAAAFLERLSQRDKGLKEKIVSWLKELAAKLKNAMSAYKDVEPDSPEGKMVAQMEDFRKEIMGIYTSALVDAGENFRENGGNNNTTREGGDVAYQARASGKEVISIKEQIASSQNELDAMEPVADIHTEDLSRMSQNQRYKWAVNILRPSGYQVDRQGFGVIEFTEKQINTGLNYLDTPGEIAALAALPRVLKRGKIIFSNDNHKFRNFGSVTIAAPIVINGVRGNMAVVVQMTTTNHYHTHRVLIPGGGSLEFKRNAAPKPSGDLTNNVRRATTISAASDDSIRNPEPVVNNESPKIFSDRDITPISKADIQKAESHFGTTRNYDIAGYLLTDGKMLDFSGKHWGDTASTYRQVDHRDIWEVWEHEDSDGTEEMVNLIGNGNIRLMPESGGINLAVKPNAAQVNELRGYINHFRGEVIVDIDRVGGDTIQTLSYNKGTSSSKILSDIKDYFDSGKLPEKQSEISQFIFSDRDPTADATRAALEKENGRLREDVSRLRELLRLQGKVTGGTVMKPSSVEAAAKWLNKYAGAKADVKELSRMLTEFYRFIATDKDYSWEDVHEHAMVIAKYLQDNVQLKPQMSDYARDVLRDIRGIKITLDDSQRAEVEYRYGSIFRSICG